MKKFVIPALVLAAASVAVPAAAQSYNSPAYGPNHGPSRAPAVQSYNNWQSIEHRKVQLDRRIDQGLRNRQLSRREGDRLKAELNSLVRLERSYMRGGLSRTERNDLDRRYDRLEAQIRLERNDRGRDDRRGFDNRRH